MRFLVILLALPLLAGAHGGCSSSQQGGVPGGRLRGDRECERLALFTETLSLVAGVSRPGSPQVSPLSVQDLANEDLALLTVEFATRRQIDGYLRENRVRPRITVEANSIQAVIDVVSRTGLATVLPDAITDDHPKLVRVPLEPTVPPRTVVLLRREHAYQSAASRAFTELIERWVHARSSRKPSGSNSHVLMT